MEDLASKKRVDFQSRRLSIIDFSSEDDSLLGLAPGFLKDDDASSESREQRSVDPIEPVDGNKSGEHFEPVDANRLQEIPETDELMPLPSECLEPERNRKNEKYNLRKSLAWDSAFFTCEGVLDAEELSTMISVDKNQKMMLPGIQEEVHRSSDSISTLGSDTLTLESVETSLFDDVRASIQRSRKPVKRAGESSKVGSCMRETKVGSGLKKVDLASQLKLKPKVATKKPNIISSPNPGKSTRPVPACPQFSQSVATSGEPTSSHIKLPKIPVKPISSSSRVVKRASLCGDLLKPEKDNAKISAGRGNPVSKVPGSFRNVPRPSKSSSLTSSITTTIGSTSTSSVTSGKPPSNSMKRKTDSKSVNPTNSSSSNPKTPSRITSGDKRFDSGKSYLSAHFVPSPSISPASSISDWSAESVSSISTSQIVSRTSRDSISKSSSKKGSIEFDTAQSVNYDDQSSIGSATQISGLPGRGALRASGGTGGLPPTSKPSGLRLPSPKIGFFDGVKTAIRTPKRNVPINLPKAGTVISPRGSGVKSKLGKVNPEKPATFVAEKPDSTRTSSTTKPKVSFSVEASKAATEVSSDLVNAESFFATTPKAETKTPVKNYPEDHPKSEEVESVISETKHSAHEEDLKFTSVCGDSVVISDLNSISNFKNPTLYEEVAKGATQREVEFNNDKLKSHSEDQIDCMIGKVGKMGITVTDEVVPGDAFTSNQKFSSEDNNGVSELDSDRDFLACLDKEDFSKELIISSSPTTENLTSQRIPFSVKDSLCNISGSFDDSKVSSEVEKSNQFPLSEEQFDREQQA